jgi:hypothetical protein
MKQNQSITRQGNFEKHGILHPDSSKAEEVGKDYINLKSRCIESIWEALDIYYHEGMGTQELQSIVRNVVENTMQ